jgi:uncharacterized sporulation protein YeaH/YhbH (DUF444 family)
MNIVDRRLNPKGRSHTNRQRFIRLVKDHIKEAVVRSIKDRALGDVDTKETVNIPRKRIQEPRFYHASQGGNREHVHPGNKEFVAGDKLPKPEGGESGGRSREGSPEGEGEDDFRFTLTREEYLDILFDELELPDLVKTFLKETVAFQVQRAGFTASGSPRNINLVRTMRHSLARRISLHRPTLDEVALVQTKIAELEAKDPRSETDEKKLHELRIVYSQLERRMKRIAFIDPVDLRFNRFEPVPKPNARAVMFCLMDVSGSMSEYMKDLAKRFFLLLHLFLQRKYERVDVVFIRHTSEAKEVDEETFFRSAETGGTVVSSALAEMKRIIDERYPADAWNIYAAQASDGDNYPSDSETCTRLLRDELLPECQYFAYIEVVDEREAGMFRSEGNASLLWRDYKTVADVVRHFTMKRVFSKSDIFPVFHQLFAKNQKVA